MNGPTECVRCGSERLIHNKPIGDGGKSSARSLYVTIGERDPDALLLKDPVTSDVHATICGDCGSVHLWVDEPKRLWQEYIALSAHGGLSHADTET